MNFCKKLLVTISIIFLLSLISCKTQNELNYLIDDWMLIENAITKDDPNLSDLFETFTLNYEAFTKSDLCRNLIEVSKDNQIKQKKTVLSILEDLSAGIENKDYDSIRIALLQLEHFDNSTTLVSNQNYLFLSELLIIILVFVTLILYIYLKRCYTILW